MQSIYQNGNYLKNNPSWHVEDSGWKARKISEIMKRNKLDPATVCEIGCGAGEILRELARNHLKTVSFFGYEITEDPLACRPDSRDERVHLEVRDILDDDAMRFDVIMAIDVIEHVEDYYSFLKKLREKAQYHVFHIPLQMNCLQVMSPGRLVGSRSSLGHLHYFTKDTAIETLKDTGYTILDYFYTTKSFDQVGRRSFKRSLMRGVRKIGYRLDQDRCVRMLGGSALMVLTEGAGSGSKVETYNGNE